MLIRNRVLQLASAILAMIAVAATAIHSDAQTEQRRLRSNGTRFGGMPKKIGPVQNIPVPPRTNFGGQFTGNNQGGNQQGNNQGGQFQGQFQGGQFQGQFQGGQFQGQFQGGGFGQFQGGGFGQF